jgi:phage gp37-like protein
MEREIDFYITSIEDAAIEALKNLAPETADVAAYGGELDAGKVEQIIEKIAPRFPLYLVSYAGGKDTRETQVSPVPGSPWFMRHDFDFVVVVADADARGEDTQRAGAYSMIGLTHRALAFRQLVAVLNEGEEDEERVVLNSGELIPTDVEHVMHLPDATVYAVPFTGYFKYLSPDRSDPAQEINSIEFEIDLITSARTPDGAPGVNVTVKE